MIYFLYGADSYRRRQKQKWIVGEYLKKHSRLTIEYFDFGAREDDGEEIAVENALKDFIKNRSLFDEFTMAVVSHIEAIAENKDAVLWLKQFLEAKDVVVVISADATPPKPLAFLLQKPVVVQKFEPLTGFAFKSFVEGEAKERGARVTEAVMAELASAYRNDIWGLMNELDMRAVAGTRAAPSIVLPENFISLIKALAYGGAREKICAVERLLENEDLGKTFNILAAFVSNGKKAQMADYDVAIKSGKLDYETALLDFAMR